MLDPIDAFPNEIAGHIFSACAVEELDEAIPRSSSGPLPLTHVCHSWRAFAHSYPALWNTLCLKKSTMFRSGHTAQISAWLDRGQDTSLSVKINSYDGEYDSESEEGDARILESLATVIGLVALHAARLRCFGLDFRSIFYTDYVFEELLRIPDFPRLETIGLGAMNSFSRPMSYSVLKIFEKARHLRSIEIVGIFETPLSAMSFPWAAMSGIAVHQFPVGNYERLLRRCTGAESLSLEINDYSGPQDTGSANHHLTCHFPRLRTLVLTCLESRMCIGNQALSLIVAPSLQSLTLWTMNPVEEGIFQSFLARCSSTLTTVDFQSLSALDISSLLRHVPRLQVLGLPCRNVNDAYLHGLTAGRGGSHEVLLPSLRRLSICCYHRNNHKAYREPVFLRMLKSRIPVERGSSVNMRGKPLICEPLKELRICQRLELTSQGWATIERMKLPGLETAIVVRGSAVCIFIVVTHISCSVMRFLRWLRFGVHRQAPQPDLQCVYTNLKSNT